MNTGTKNDSLSIYAMSNISKEDYDFLRKLNAPWHLFDEVFASGYAGMRKPEAGFYEFVLREIGLEGRAADVIFVDDKLENVEAAKAQGLHAVQFKSATETGAEVRRLLNLQADTNTVAPISEDSKRNGWLIHTKWLLFAFSLAACFVLLS